MRDRLLLLGLSALLAGCGDVPAVEDGSVLSSGLVSASAEAPASPYFETEFLDSFRLVRAEARAAAQPCLDEIAAGQRGQHCRRYTELARLYGMSAGELRSACRRHGAGVPECSELDHDPVRRAEYTAALDALTDAQLDG